MIKITDWTTYTKYALKTESLLSQNTALNLYLIWAVMNTASKVGTLVDLAKRQIFYKKEITTSQWSETITEIQLSLSHVNDAARKKDAPAFHKLTMTCDQLTPVNLRFIHAGFGLITESAEIAETLMSALQEQKFTRKHLDNLKEEIGDLFWYLAIFINALRLKFGLIMSVNIAKLIKRFPEGFSEEKANNRDLEVEQKLIAESK